MALIDCTADGGSRCGKLALFANLSDNPVRLEIQYPGNDNVWYTLGSFRPGEMFQSGPSNLLFPGDSQLRASLALQAPASTYYYMGKIIQGEENLFYLPKLGLGTT
jgi:hypothetical protein